MNAWKYAGGAQNRAAGPRRVVSRVEVCGVCAHVVSVVLA